MRERERGREGGDVVGAIWYVCVCVYVWMCVRVLYDVAVRWARWLAGAGGAVVNLVLWMMSCWHGTICVSDVYVCMYVCMYVRRSRYANSDMHVCIYTNTSQHPRHPLLITRPHASHSPPQPRARSTAPLGSRCAHEAACGSTACLPRACESSEAQLEPEERARKQPRAAKC